MRMLKDNGEGRKGVTELVNDSMRAKRLLIPHNAWPRESHTAERRPSKTLPL